jgi:quercetin dioxygenase-like cupin family protein
MPHVSRESALLKVTGPVQDRSADVGDEYTVSFMTFEVDTDGTELVRGLPGDRCPSPHWGYVFSGQLTFRTDDGEEVYGPGDAFYLAPGHVPMVAAGTEYVQFSPTEQVRAVAEHMMRRAQELAGRH